MLIDEPEISRLVRRDKKFVVTKFRPHKPHRAANRISCRCNVANMIYQKSDQSIYLSRKIL